MIKTFLFILLSAISCIHHASACTSAIVSGKVTKSGRPMMWKHRDTSAEHNFVDRIPAENGNHAFVALFNGGDSLRSQAWMGMNDAGFAIMNTASYNLMPDTATVKDCEGFLMRHALERCTTLSDFETLLRELPKPLGVQANFGVMDAEGNSAYFETDDYSFTRFDLADEPEGIIYRTNYSCSGDKGGGYGYIREENARRIIGPAVESRQLMPEDFTEKASRSFYHSLIGRDFSEGTDAWVIDQDFIPRKSSAASVVIEGLLPGESADMMTMWTVVGYPPVSHVEAVTINNVPADLQPLEPGYRSKTGNESMERKKQVFSIERGNGPHYLNINKIKEYSPRQQELSHKAYLTRRQQMNQ